jgi:hypothetical protein
MIVTIILDILGVSYVCRTFKNESIQITKLVASIDNLGSQGTVTKQSFRLPLVDDLLEALGDITDPGIDAKVNLNNAITGRILIDGFERFKGSFFVVNAVDGKSSKQVELLFQGNETDLKAKLSNITMAELYDNETVLYNYTEIEQYFDAPENYRDLNGYIFPIINFGQNYNYLQFSTQGLSESDFKVATTFKKAFELMPFNITTTGIDNLMNQVIVLHNDKNQYPKLDTSPLNNTGIISSNASRTINLQSPPVVHTIQMDAEVDYSNPIKQGNAYKANVTGWHSFNYSSTLLVKRNSSGQSIWQFFFFVERGGSNINTIPLIHRTERATPNGLNYSNSGNESIYLEAGDLLTLGIDSRANETRILGGAAITCVVAPAFLSTSNIDISANCPELTAWDIFRTIAIQCNAQIITNADGTYEMIPWTDWIESGTEVIILDNIIEESVDVQIKPFSVQGAKSIRLQYKDNSDFLSTQFKELTNETFGTKAIANTGTEFAKNELKIELPVSTIPHKNVSFTGCPIPSFTDKEGKIIIGSPTILNSSAATGSMSWTLKSLFSSASKFYSTVPFTGNWQTIAGGFNETDSNFGQSLSYFASSNYPSLNLYERYWKKYLQETYSEQSRELKVNVKLDLNKIDGLNFNEKFYYKNTLLRLVELEGVSLTSNEPATATFMKRFTIFNSDIAAYYPYDIINSIVQWKDSANNDDVGDGSSIIFPVPFILSAAAYGFYYDALKQVATQNGQILIT